MKINHILKMINSVCAFLNRNGGHLFLGVKNDETIVEIEEKSVDKVKKDFVTSINNPFKISPTFYLIVDFQTHFLRN